MPIFLEHPTIPGGYYIRRLPSEPQFTGSIGVAVALDKTRVSGNGDVITVTIVTSELVDPSEIQVNTTPDAFTVGAISAVGGATNTYTCQLTVTSALSTTRTEAVIVTVSHNVESGFGQANFMLDRLAPPVITGVTATGQANAILVQWALSSAGDIDHYRIWRAPGLGASSSTASVIGTSAGTVFTDAPLNAGDGYTYFISAVDTVGNESVLTGEVGASATVQGDIQVNLVLSTHRPGGANAGTGTVSIASGTATFAANQTGLLKAGQYLRVNSAFYQLVASSDATHWTVTAINGAPATQASTAFSICSAFTVDIYTDLAVTPSSCSVSVSPTTPAVLQIVSPQSVAGNNTATTHNQALVISYAPLGAPGSALDTRALLVAITDATTGKKGAASESFAIKAYPPNSVTLNPAVGRIESIYLTWTPNADDTDIASYTIYRSQQPASSAAITDPTAAATAGYGPGAIGTATSPNFLDAVANYGTRDGSTGVLPTYQYVYWVTATDTNGNTGAYSNGVSGTGRSLITEDLQLAGVDISRVASDSSVTTNKLAAAAVTATKLGILQTAVDYGSSFSNNSTLDGSNNLVATPGSVAWRNLVLVTAGVKYPADPALSGGTGLITIGDALDGGGNLVTKATLTSVQAQTLRVNDQLVVNGQTFTITTVITQQTFYLDHAAGFNAVTFAYRRLAGYYGASSNGILWWQASSQTVQADNAYARDLNPDTSTTTAGTGTLAIAGTTATFSVSQDGLLAVGMVLTAGAVNVKLVRRTDATHWVVSPSVTVASTPTWSFARPYAGVMTATEKASSAYTGSFEAKFIPGNGTSVSDVILGFNQGGTFQPYYAGTVINGDQILTNAISAQQLDVNELSAITANVGTLAAGLIQDKLTSPGSIIRMGSSYTFPDGTQATYAIPMNNDVITTAGAEAEATPAVPMVIDLAAAPWVKPPVAGINYRWLSFRGLVNPALAFNALTNPFEDKFVVRSDGTVTARGSVNAITVNVYPITGTSIGGEVYVRTSATAQADIALLQHGLIQAVDANLQSLSVAAQSALNGTIGLAQDVMSAQGAAFVGPSSAPFFKSGYTSVPPAGGTTTARSGAFSVTAGFNDRITVPAGASGASNVPPTCAITTNLAYDNRYTISFHASLGYTTFIEQTSTTVTLQWTTDGGATWNSVKSWTFSIQDNSDGQGYDATLTPAGTFTGSTSPDAEGGGGDWNVNETVVAFLPPAATAVTFRLVTSISASGPNGYANIGTSSGQLAWTSIAGAGGYAKLQTAVYPQAESTLFDAPLYIAPLPAANVVSAIATTMANPQTGELVVVKNSASGKYVLAMYDSANWVTFSTSADGPNKITVNATSGISDLEFTPTLSVAFTSGVATIGLPNTGVAAGAYTKVTVDAQGRVTAGTTITAADIGAGTFLNGLFTMPGGLSLGTQLSATTDNTVDIGASATRFRSFYLAGTATLGAAVILDQILQRGGGAARFENTFATLTGAVGVGLELGVSNGRTLVQAYDRTNSVLVPLNINASRLCALTDNAYDIGASGANRFRDLFLARDIHLAGFVYASSAVYAAGSFASSQTFPSISARGVGSNSLEWGHANSAGYGSTIGYENSSGAPYIAFNAEAGATNNTYKTRGLKGVVVRADLAGGLFVYQLAANADNQSLAQLGGWNSNGHFVPGTDNAYDLGVSGSNRFRNLYLSATATAGQYAATSGVTSAASRTTLSYGDDVNTGRLTVYGPNPSTIGALELYVLSSDGSSGWGAHLNANGSFSFPTSILVGLGGSFGGNVDIPNGNSFYVQSTGLSLNAQSANYWIVHAGVTAGAGLWFQNTNGATEGYVYYDTSGFGLLNSTGTWSVQCTAGSTSVYMPGVVTMGSATVQGALYSGGAVKWNSSYSSYTTDGLFGATATPGGMVGTPAGASRQVLLGYADNGSGLYAPRLGWTDGTNKYSMGLWSNSSFFFTVGNMGANIWAADNSGNFFVYHTHYNYSYLHINEGNFGVGLVGNYDPTRYRNVYTMGGDYTMAADGTSLTTGSAAGFYGFYQAYDDSSGTYPLNITGYGLSHGLGVAQAGQTISFIGRGIWTAGSIFGNFIRTDTTFDIAGHVVLSSNPGVYTQLVRQDGIIGIYLGTSGNYYDSTTHYWRSQGGSTTFAQLSSSLFAVNVPLTVSGNVTLANTGTNFVDAFGHSMVSVVISNTTPTGTAAVGTLWVQY